MKFPPKFPQKFPPKSSPARLGMIAVVFGCGMAGMIPVIAGPTTTETTTTTQSTMPTTAFSGGSPKSALKAYNLAMRTGDLATMTTLQHAETDDEKHVARSTSESDLQVGRAEQAARDKFGDDGAKQIAAALDDQDDAAIDAAREEITGNHADVTFEADVPPVRMIRDQAGWAVDVAALLKSYKGSADELCNGVIRRGSVAKVTAQELTAGQFATLAAAVESVKGRLRDD